MANLNEKLQSIKSAASTVYDKVYNGLNEPSYGKAPPLGGDSTAQINGLVGLVLLAITAAILFGFYMDRYHRGGIMEGRPRFWAIFLLVISYVILIPGLLNPLFSFTIAVDVLGNRKNIQPEDGHPVCTENTTGLAHLLLKTGSNLGAVLVILFSMVIPAIELIMLIVGETFRFAGGCCAEVFRYVIVWVQHRSKWASPDMFAYVFLVHLVHTLDHRPLILTNARLEIGFACFSVFVVTATASAIGVPLPRVNLQEGGPKAPLVYRCLGDRGVAVTTVILAACFMVLFFLGITTPCMAMSLDTKQLFPPYGPLPENFKPAIEVLDLSDMLASETSVVSCVQDLFARLASGEATVLISLALMCGCVIGCTLFDMVFLVIIALRNGFRGAGYSKLADTNGQRCSWMSAARLLRKLSMLDVSMVGVWLVTECMAMYAKYGVAVVVRHGVWICLAAELFHSVAYYIVESAIGYQEALNEHESEALKGGDGLDEDDKEIQSNMACGCVSSRVPQMWRSASPARTTLESK